MNDLTQPLGLIPRQAWLRQRVIECVDALRRMEDLENWDAYRMVAKTLADELTYAVTEWEKYYNDNQ